MNDNMEIGRRIKSAREEKGMTQEELGKILGLNKSSIQRYETGKIQKIKLPILENIAFILDVNPSWLALKTNDPKYYGENTNAPGSLLNEPIESNIRSILPQENIRMIPVYDSVSAGFGSYADSTVKEYMPLYIESDEEAENTMCINVDGDSMEPKIEDGDTIQVLRQSTCDNGDIAVILIDREEGVVKKVQFDNNSTTLISFNTDYPPRVFVGEEQNRLMIQGVVKAIIKRL